MFSQEEQPSKNDCLRFSVGELHLYYIIDFSNRTWTYKAILIPRDVCVKGTKHCGYDTECLDKHSIISASSLLCKDKWNSVLTL